MLYARGVGLAKNYVPTKTPLSQASRLCPRKARSYEPKALNEIMLPMRRKISLTISHTQHRTLPIPTPILTLQIYNVFKSSEAHLEIQHAETRN